MPVVRKLSDLAFRRAKSTDVEAITLGSGAGVRLFRPTGVTEPTPWLIAKW